MEVRVGEVMVFSEERGTGRPVLVLHGAGVDHRETEACFELVFERLSGYRRLYPDLPGMGRSPAPASLSSADDVLEVLLGFAEEVTGGSTYLLVGHSAGGYYAQAMAARTPERVAGLALVCPLLADVRDVPEHRVVVGPGDLRPRRGPLDCSLGSRSGTGPRPVARASSSIKKPFPTPKPSAQGSAQRRGGDLNFGAKCR